MKVRKCRICNNPNLTSVIDMGRMPLANEFVEDPGTEEKEYPLRVVWCDDCGLMQLDEVVPPKELFSEYVYVSGTSDQLEWHFDDLASVVIDRFNFKKGDQVLDIGSNDGTLLRQFQEREFDVLGVEPATNISKIARENGIRTVNKFFEPAVAAQLADEHGRCDVVTATNVFAHTHEVDSFLEGISRILSSDGVLILEVPYLLDLLKKTEFDTIYHEHLSYFSIRPLRRLFEEQGFKLLDVERVDIHGGSIRIFAAKDEAPRDSGGSVGKLIELEKRKGLHRADVYKQFATRVRELKTELVGTLTEIISEDKTIAGYGAAAKGNTLLNYYDIGADFLEFIADKNQLKHGLFTPGSNIEVVPPGRIYENEPDYLLILAWNFAEEIMEQQSAFREDGGRFIVPIPEVEIF